MKILQILILLLPWRARRHLLNRILGFDIGDNCYIGFSLVFANQVRLGDHARIGHLNLFRNMETLDIGEASSIGNMNWVAGGSKVRGSFFGESDRDPSLFLGKHSAITHQHVFDCTNRISIGSYSTVAGYRSQFITHGIDFIDNCQRSGTISIGDFSLIGTNVTVLKSSRIPSRCVLAAGSVVAKYFENDNCLIAGVPAVEKRKAISGAYFSRESGRVS